MKWWPALLQSLLGLQCQSRPSAAYVQKNGLQSRIRRVCHHPLTVSGPKPAFKWSKHRGPPKSGERAPGRPPFGSGEEAHSARYSAPHTRLLPELNIPSVRYLTQHYSILICVVQMTHSSLSCYFRELGAILKACRPDARARQRTQERTPASAASPTV